MSQYIARGLLLSLLIHLLFGFSIAQQKTPIVHPPLTIDAIIAPEFIAKKHQIVSPSDSEPTTPPENAELLSDKDTSVAREQIKRGDNPFAGAAPGQLAAAQVTSPPGPATPERVPPEKTPTQTKLPERATPAPEKNAFLEKKTPEQPLQKSLDLSPRSDFLKNLSSQATEKNNQKVTSESVPQLVKPFSRAAGSGAQFLGFNGNSDYLPNIRDGDVTLLNAKADKYAVFVRRVAIRVFHLLKQYGWEYMRASDFRSLTRFTSVRAILSKEGKFLSVSLEDSSGNRTFDDIVKRSITDGATDPNPPESALLANGTYQFIFLARSWTQTSGSRQGGLQERRWLSLKTGLE